MSSEEEEIEENLSPVKSTNLSPIRTSIAMLTRKLNPVISPIKLNNEDSLFQLELVNQTTNN